MTDNKDESLKETGRCAAASIIEMVAALDVDYDRLDEMLAERNAEPETTFSPWWVAELEALKQAAGECASRDDAEQHIREDALSVEVRTGWYVPSDCVDARDRPTAEEFRILLATGGPAVRIMGELSNGEPERAWLEVQDWGTPWTRYFDIEQDTLLAYARCFYYGES